MSTAHNDSAEAATRERLAAGSQRLALYIGLVLATSLVVILLSNAARGSAKLPQQVIRLILTSVLLWFVWNGSQVARWLTIVLTGVAGAFALLSSLLGAGKMPLTLVMLLMGLTYLAFAFELAFPTAVRAFVDRQAAMRNRIELDP